MTIGAHVKVTSSTKAIVQECLARSSDRREAIECLATQARQDRALFESLTEGYCSNLLIEVCATAISYEARAIRARHSPAAGEIIAKAETLLRKIELWTLEGSGVKLLSALRQEVETAIAFKRRLIAGHEEDVAFYEAIIKKLKPGQAVSARWTAAGLADLLNNGHI